MRGIRVWARLLGLARAVVEDVFLDGEAVVVCVRPRAREQSRCPLCRRRCPGYDWGDGRRRWRALDLGTTFAYVEAEAPRVECKRHGVLVAAVPWARHDSAFTAAFEDQAAWLAANTSARAVAQLMRTPWPAVGGDLPARLRGGPRPARPAGRPSPAGIRRDLGAQGPELPHGRRRSPHRPAGLGRPRARPHDGREVLDLPRRAASSIGSKCPKSAATVITSAAITIWCSLATACAL